MATQPGRARRYLDAIPHALRVHIPNCNGYWQVAIPSKENGFQRYLASHAERQVQCAAAQAQPLPNRPAVFGGVAVIKVDAGQYLCFKTAGRERKRDWLFYSGSVPCDAAGVGFWRGFLPALYGCAEFD